MESRSFFPTPSIANVLTICILVVPVRALSTVTSVPNTTVVHSITSTVHRNGTPSVHTTDSGSAVVSSGTQVNDNSTISPSFTLLSTISTTSNAANNTNDTSHDANDTSSTIEVYSTPSETTLASESTSTHTAASSATTTTTATTAVQTTPIYVPPSTTTPSNLLALPLGIILSVVIIAIVALVVYCNINKIRKLAGCVGETSDRGSDAEEAQPQLPPYTSLVVPADKFLEHLEEMKMQSDFKYAEQFESLQMVGREQATDSALVKRNLIKNRYVNIHPYDVTRVKLLPVENDEGSDYINASWIPGYYSKREYIAAQGPLPSTEDDMWRMIWEYNCKGIIMLTKCFENGNRKCDQYWPEDNEPVVFGDIQVILVSEVSEPDLWTIKKLDLSMGQQKRSVKLFHFIDWPDRGVPESPQMLLRFMEVVQVEIDKSKSGPLVVHCSAGVGRTGTYIAIETLMQQLANEEQVDVFGVVYRLRLNRVFMVQTECQYKFIHETVGHIIQMQENQEPQEETAVANESDVVLYANAEDYQLKEVGTKRGEATRSICINGREAVSQT